MSEELVKCIERGLSAVAETDVDAAKAALEQALAAGGREDGRVAHLQGLVSWLTGNLEDAAAHLLRAVDAAPTEPIVQLDAAEFLFVEGELQEAEGILRDFLDRVGEAESADDARMLLSQLRLEDDDPEESLEILDTVTAGRDRVEYLASRGGVLLALGRLDESVEVMRRAVDIEPDDADLKYQLGVVLYAANDREGSREVMVQVHRMDAAAREAGGSELDGAQQRDLQERFEAVLEEVPEPILKQIAGVPVTVDAAPSEDDVRAGLDPRNAVAFYGQAVEDGGEAKLERIVVMRDILVDGLDEFDELSEDEQIHELLFEHTLVELRRFLGLEELMVAGV